MVISTSIVNISVEKIPSSYPMLITTTSTSPRVLSSSPSEREDFAVCPASRADSEIAPNFDSTATKSTASNATQCEPEVNIAKSVRNPVKMKNNGSSNTTLISSNFSVIIC